jgi:hypothetical protein
MPAWSPFLYQETMSWLTSRRTEQTAVKRVETWADERLCRDDAKNGRGRRGGDRSPQPRAAFSSSSRRAHPWRMHKSPTRTAARSPPTRSGRSRTHRSRLIVEEAKRSAAPVPWTGPKRGSSPRGAAIGFQYHWRSDLVRAFDEEVPILGRLSILFDGPRVVAEHPGSSRLSASPRARAARLVRVRPRRPGREPPGQQPDDGPTHRTLPHSPVADHALACTPRSVAVHRPVGRVPRRLEPTRPTAKQVDLDSSP